MKAVVFRWSKHPELYCAVSDNELGELIEKHGVPDDIIVREGCIVTAGEPDPFLLDPKYIGVRLREISHHLELIAEKALGIKEPGPLIGGMMTDLRRIAEGFCPAKTSRETTIKLYGEHLAQLKKKREEAGENIRLPLYETTIDEEMARIEGQIKLLREAS